MTNCVGQALMTVSLSLAVLVGLIVGGRDSTCFSSAVRTSRAWRRTVTKWSCMWLLLVTGGVGNAFAANPLHVVLLTGVDPIQPAAFVQLRMVRSIIEAGVPQGVEIYLDALDVFRFEDANLTPEFLALMKKKYAAQRVDLVIGFGDHAADFMREFHNEIWPGAPVLLTSLPQARLDQHPLPSGFSYIPFQIDIVSTLAIAEALQPSARHLIVVGGATDVDAELVQRVVEAAATRKGRWPVVDTWKGLPISELETRLAALDRDTAVVYTTAYRDRNGRRFFPYQLVAAMVAASRAPIYAWYSTYMDSGITAGAVYDFEENGRLTGEAALSILRSGGKGSGGAFPALPAQCTANVAQLERYGLSASALPSGCRLINYPRSLFRDYRGPALIFLSVLLAQSVTIVALLAQRRSRRRAEADATAWRGELARAARFATVGELSASIAHEVGQPLGAILSNADAAELLVKTAHVDSSELQEILSDVKRDALRANDVVQRLRALLQKQGVAYGLLPLDRTLQHALTLVEPEARRRGVFFDTRFDCDNVEVMGDQVQLQQVVLNLAINAMDAMSGTEPNNRVLTIETKQLVDGVEFIVADRGSGFDAASASRLFEPFYTTKPHGMGLGLSIVRSIVESHHGRVSVERRAGGGTTFAVWLPCAGTLSASAGTLNKTAERWVQKTST